jgi:uncharacterized protein (TIGR02246 family)
MRRLLLGVLLVSLALSSSVLGQPATDPEYQKFMDSFTAAYNKGDAAGIASHYTANGLRIAPDGQVQSGRDAIQQAYAASLAGPFKGARIALTAKESRQLTPDTHVVVGSYDITGGSIGAMSGMYMNTLVREGGVWRIAANTAMRPAAPPPAK